MSRTRSARSRNSAASWVGRPNSLTSVAPGAENRSVIWVPMDAFRSAFSRRRSAMVRPIRRAGSTKTGSRISASTVTCQARVIITATASASWMELLSTEASVVVTADWAPTTSLLSRLTSAPVRVRVKNATGWRCTWSNTAARRSRISPSPSDAESQRCTIPLTATATAMTAMSTASPTTTLSGPWLMIASTTRPASTGVATASTAPTTLTSRNAAIRRWCGLTNATIRRSVAMEKGRFSSWAFAAWYIEFHATISMLMSCSSFRSPHLPRTHRTWGVGRTHRCGTTSPRQCGEGDRQFSIDFPGSGANSRS
jgi:hypothetical protein